VRTLRLAAVAACLVATAACSGGSYSVPEPKSVSSLPPTSAAQDFSGVVLAGVSGKTTTTTIVLGPGPASLKGSVVGPEGAVPGATVHIERFVGAAMASANIATAADGTWTAPAVLGGRYRVRAFRPPDLALTKPAVFFLGGTEAKVLDLQLSSYTGLVATASIAPDPPYVDQTANLVVRISQQSVDANGVVRGMGVFGAQVELQGTGDWRVDSANPVSTDSDGDAFWAMRCRQSGTQPLAVLVNGLDTLAFTLPPCVELFTETPPDETSTSSTFRRSTSTTRRTTTTTSP
jgi:hypothetical protein